MSEEFKRFFVMVERVTRYSKLRILFALLTFRLIVGFIVVAWSPYSILSAHPGRSLTELAPFTVAGAILIGAGAFGYLWCTWDFAVIGLSFGPPLPVARGIYGFLRHPMYFSLILVLLGESLFFKSWRVLGYASVVALMVHIFVILYEEPQMVKKWGTVYLQYAERVPRWIPRIRRYTSQQGH
ncbi:MAG TPA: isoprenylcysteine carboxylmethyltransferase family protein [Bryobacteraceae bacterium]|nr:isoprenylcysteine carboxylmethyltransferase family protein [Bryobacteraceae bacterium]